MSPQRALHEVGRYSQQSQLMYKRFEYGPLEIGQTVTTLNEGFHFSRHVSTYRTRVNKKKK